VSANTYVTQRVWRGARKVLAGLAGAAVSTTGVATTVMAVRDLGGFNLVSSVSRINLQTAPAGMRLGDHSSLAAAARLVDPALTDGLQPGESAYFGYTLALSADSVPLAAVSMDPAADGGDESGLTYEVRQAFDATQCRRDWAQGSVLVPPRTFADPASPTFDVGRVAEGSAEGITQLCIRVTLSESATSTQTGSVAWRFVASAAQ
jgi:hypothetical protein